MATVLIMTSPEIRPLLQVVADDHHDVIAVATSGDVLGQVINQQPDIIILPEGAEPVEGVDLLAVLRRMTDASIIVVGTEGESHTVQALMLGADFCVSPAVTPRVFQARLRALLRPLQRRRISSSRDVSRKGDRRSFKVLLRNRPQASVALTAQQLPSPTCGEMRMKDWSGRGGEPPLRQYIAWFKKKLIEHGVSNQPRCNGTDYGILPLGHVPA